MFSLFLNFVVADINALKVIPASDEEMADKLSDRNVAHTDPRELLQELEKLETWLTEDSELYLQQKIAKLLFTLLVRLLSIQNYRAEHQLLAVVRSLAKILSSNYNTFMKNENINCIQVLAIIFHEKLDQRDLF